MVGLSACVPLTERLGARKSAEGLRQGWARILRIPIASHAGVHESIRTGRGGGGIRSADLRRRCAMVRRPPARSCRAGGRAQGARRAPVCAGCAAAVDAAHRRGAADGGAARRAAQRAHRLRREPHRAHQFPGRRPHRRAAQADRRPGRRRRKSSPTWTRPSWAPRSPTMQKRSRKSGARRWRSLVRASCSLPRYSRARNWKPPRQMRRRRLRKRGAPLFGLPTSIHAAHRWQASACRSYRRWRAS